MEKPITKKKMAKKKGHCWQGMIMILIVAVIAIVALIGAANSNFSLYKHHLMFWQKSTPHKTQFYSISARINQLQSQIDQLNASMNAASQAQPAATKTAPVSVPNIKGVQTKVNALYAHLAAFNLQVALAQANVFGKLKSTEAAMNQARVDLMHSGQTAAVNALNDSLVAVQKLQPVDVNLLLKKIDKLEKTLSQLKFKPPVSAADLASESQAVTSAKTGKVKAALDQSWHKIKGLLVVRHGDTIGQKLLTDSNRVAALASIRLQLQYARFYAIRDESALYKKSLQEAMALASLYCQKTAALKAWQQSAANLMHASIGHRLAVLKSGLEQALTKLKGAPQ